MRDIFNKAYDWLTSGNTSSYLVMGIIALICLYLIYKFRENKFIKDIIANVLMEEERKVVKGEGKILDIAKKVRDRLPKFISIILKDRKLKKLIADGIDTLQEKLNVDEISIEIDETRKIVEAYEIIRDNDCATDEMKQKVQERINELLDKLEKIKKC